MKEERIFIEIYKLEDGKMIYTVGGGIEDDGQMEDYASIEGCIDEVKRRCEYTVKEFNR